MISPLSLVVYENRTSFATIAPFVPVISSLGKLNSLAWSKGVYGWHLELDFGIDNITPTMAHFWLQNVLGRLVRLKIYGSIEWEGMLYGVTAELPGATLTRSMSEMANSVYVEYSVNETGAQDVTSEAADATSKAKYGTKEVYVPGGTMGATRAAAHAARYLASHKDPPIVSEINERPAGTARIRCRAVGYYITATWQWYTSTTAGTQDSATTIGDIATAECAFWNATHDLDATGRTLERRFPQRATAWDQMLSLASQGTSNDLKYFLGVKKNRKVTGWEEPITLSYLKYPSKPGVWYDATGGFPLQYWQIEPGQWAKVGLASYDNESIDRDNPQAVIIGSCNYDAVARTVRPSYGIQVPTGPRPSARERPQETRPFSRQWSTTEWGQGYRQVFHGGRWLTQYRHGFTPTPEQTEKLGLQAPIAPRRIW